MAWPSSFISFGPVLPVLVLCNAMLHTDARAGDTNEMVMADGTVSNVANKARQRVADDSQVVVIAENLQSESQRALHGDTAQARLLRREASSSAANEEFVRPAIFVDKKSEERVEDIPGKPGAAGKPGLVVARISGSGGAAGPPGPPGIQGPLGPKGPPGASRIGHRGRLGPPGVAGRKGELGEPGEPGHPGKRGTAGGPPSLSHGWTKLLDYYKHIVTHMENSSGAELRRFNKEISMMQQQSALYHARTYALSNGSADLHEYMQANYHHMQNSIKDSQAVDNYAMRMPVNMPREMLNDANRLMPVYIVDRKVASRVSKEKEENSRKAVKSFSRQLASYYHSWLTLQLIILTELA
eukprot:TRINITY_DN9121_c0_g2_i1.p1 TRINITY_DN9121_c0_g2~~TRINITY_DN9121_c0_g2_i1.p1  ORF type:complete len:355 (+),score=61.40 TRINITY_DN9121_c0_g2_i1:92-1156(+)